MKILFINACVRDEDSRTLKLAKKLLDGLDGNIKEVKLASLDLKPLDREKINERLTNPALQTYAKEFSSADTIVIAAPMWDLSFPALLKLYIENITIGGITFKYTPNGPLGLCNAEKLYYVSTSGGKFIPNYGYHYIKALANNLFGIEYTKCFYAEYLDIWGNDIDGIVDTSLDEIDLYFENEKSHL